MVFLTKKKSDDNSVKIGKNNTFHGDAAIGANSKIIKDSIIIDNSRKTRYKSPKRDTTILNNYAPGLIMKYGRKKIGIGGIISLLAGIFTILSGFKSLLPQVQNKFSIVYLDIIPSFPQFGILVFSIGLCLLILGIFFLKVIEYHDITWCEKCEHDFAYEEIGNPDVVETPTRFGYNVETTHTLKCKYCGNIKTYPEIHEYDKEGNLLR